MQVKRHTHGSLPGEFDSAGVSRACILFDISGNAYDLAGLGNTEFVHRGMIIPGDMCPVLASFICLSAL